MLAVKTISPISLSSPFRINTLELPNRLVRSAIHENMVDSNGIPTQKYQALYQQVSNSGVGLIITGHMFVNRNGRTFSGMTEIHSDKVIPVLQKVTDLVHTTKAKIFAQLNHAGYRVLPEVDKKIVAPSKVGHAQTLTRDEIEEIIQDFGRAAVRTKKAGFDGVQIHGAHSYLIAQFLSRNRNRRRDRYGGSLENRQRFCLEVYQQIRDKVGTNFPVIIKLDSYSHAISHLVSPRAFITLKESLLSAKLLEDAGIDGIEVSCGFYAARGAIPLKTGTYSNFIALGRPKTGRVISSFLTPFDLVLNRRIWFKPHHNIDHIKQFKQQCMIPILAGSSFRDPVYMSMVVAKNWADMICLARPLIIEPDFPQQILNGSTTPSRCINCNLCLSMIPLNHPLQCYYGTPKY